MAGNIGAEKIAGGKTGKRAVRSTTQVIENANRAVERATNGVVQLHIKANNMAGVQGILDARKALSAALVAPSSTTD